MRLILAGMICLCMAGFSGSTVAQSDAIYRWTDENGTIHFGATPPDGVDATTVDTNMPTSGVGVDTPPPAPAGDETEEAEAEPGSAEARRTTRNERRTENRQSQEELDARCEFHRKQVEQLEPSPRVLVQDRETGEVYRLDDNERLKLVQESRDFIDQNCD